MTAGMSSSPSPATLSWIELQQFQRTNFWNKALLIRPALKLWLLWLKKTSGPVKV